MDITSEVLKKSPSTERLWRTWYRYGTQVVICRRDSRPHQPTPTSHENANEVIPVSRLGRSNSQPIARVDNSLTCESKLYFDNTPNSIWTLKDTLTLKEWLIKNFKLKSLTVNRKADLKIRPAGRLNLGYLGTLVVIQGSQLKGCQHVLVIARWITVNPARESLINEIVFNLLNAIPQGIIYTLELSQFNNQHMLIRRR